MAWWWDKSRGRQAGGNRPGFEPTVPSAPPSTGYLDSGRSRYEVCPPALLDDDFDAPRRGVRSLLPPMTTIRQWLQTGWYSTEQASPRTTAPELLVRARVDRSLIEARNAFVAALADVGTPAAAELSNRARAAHTLRELWHLRNPLFTTVSIGHCESIARDRLAELNRHFPVREQGNPRRGGPPDRTPASPHQHHA